MNEAEVRKIVEAVLDRVLAGSAPQAPPSAEGTGSTPTPTPAPTPAAGNPSAGRLTVALGADHGGFELKESLRAHLQAKGHTLVDLGCHSREAVDYPDIAAAVGRAVASGQAARGIILDGAGIGSSMAANKVKGVRAALCYNEKTIVNSVAHNNANVLTMGAPFHTPAEAAHLVELWLATQFEGGRHEKRVEKIMALEGGCGCSSKK